MVNNSVNLQIYSHCLSLSHEVQEEIMHCNKSWCLATMAIFKACNYRTLLHFKIVSQIEIDAYTRFSKLPISKFSLMIYPQSYKSTSEEMNENNCLQQVAQYEMSLPRDMGFLQEVLA